MSKRRTRKNNNGEHYCCYSPTSHHEFCTHKDKCILNLESWEYYNPRLSETIQIIKDIRKLIGDYDKILADYLNGIIVYHPTLDECYDIRIVRNQDGKVETQVSVSSNFKSVIRVKKDNLKLQLKDWNRELYRLKKEME